MTDTAGREGIPAPTLQVIGAGLGHTGTRSLRGPSSAWGLVLATI